MNAKIIGLVIIAIGLVMTLYTGFNYVTKEKVVDIGNIEITADKDHTASWSPYIGIGVMVIGVSKDSPESHKKFKEQHNLTFPLWSDPDHKLLSAFGAWGEKKMFGKIYMGIIRSTFIIDPKGTIIKTWEKVSPKNHDQEVLEFMSKQT